MSKSEIILNYYIINYSIFGAVSVILVLIIVIYEDYQTYLNGSLIGLDHHREYLQIDNLGSFSKGDKINCFC